MTPLPPKRGCNCTNRLNSHTGAPLLIQHKHALRTPASHNPSRPSTQLAANTHMGEITATPGMRFGVVVARFNSLVTKQLLEGALEDFERHGVHAEDVDVSVA